MRLLPIFRWCTTWMIGTGESISFWLDSWHGQPLITMLEPGQKPHQPKISLRDAEPIINELMPGYDLKVNLNSDRDALIWKWTARGIYSANSAYKILITGGKIEFEHAYLWKLPVPPTVRIFSYLMIQDRILIGEVMLRRHMVYRQTCLMCQNCPSESAIHLLFLCPNAVQIWFGVAAHFGFRVMIPKLTIDEIICTSRQQAELEGEAKRKVWNSLFMCTCWMIWKQRNNKVFTGVQTPTEVVVNRIIEETRLWMKCCAPGRMARDHTLIEDPD